MPNAAHPKFYRLETETEHHIFQSNTGHIPYQAVVWIEKRNEQQMAVTVTCHNSEDAAKFHTKEETTK